MLPRYHFAKNRLFLIDLEGSLWSEDPKLVKEQGFVLPERTRDVLRALVRGNGEGKNVVWVLSGLPVKGVLEKVVADIPELGVVYVIVLFQSAIDSRR